MNLNQPALMRAIGVGVGAGVIIGIFSSIPLVSLACCCIGWALWIGVWAAYGYFDEKAGNPPNTGSYAMAGAITGGIGGITWGVVSGAIAVILSLLGVTAAATAETLAQLESSGALPPGFAEQMAATSGTGIGAVIFSICYGLIFYAVLGAIGGLIYAMVKGRQAPSNTFTPPPAM